MSHAPRGVLATLCLTVTVSYGTLYYAFAVLASEIARDTGWSLPALTGAFSLGQVTSGVVGIAAGRTIQAQGPRRVMVWGAAAGAGGLFAVAASPSYGWFLAAMVLSGAGAAGLFYAPAFAAITHWYGAARVRALTTLTLVAGFASTIFAPTTTALAEQLGWRGTYVVLATLLLVVAVPAHLLALRHPWDLPSTAAHRARDREVVTSAAFGCLAVGAALVTAAMYASLVSLVPLLVDRGLSLSAAAWALGLGGAGQVAGRLLYARMDRHLGLQLRAVLVSGGVGVTIVALAVVPGPVVVLLTVSVVAGAARGLFTLVGATLVTDLWGPERYASLNGVLGAPVTFAAATGPVLGAALAYATGSHATAFGLLGGLALLGAALVGLAVGMVESRREPAPDVVRAGRRGSHAG